MASYKVQQGFYHEIKPMEITLPDGFELLTGGDRDIGHGKFDGLFHWIGCMTQEFYESNKDSFKGNHMDFYDCGPLKIFTLHNVKFDDEYPHIISVDDFNEKWQFSRFRVAEFSEDFRLKNMIRILRINSEFKIDALEVTNRDYFDFDDFKKMEIHDDYSISKILTGKKSTIHVSDNEIALDYWNQLVHNIVHQYGASIEHKNIDINAAHNVVKNIPSNPDQFFDEIKDGYEEWKASIAEAEEFMDFKKVKFI
jgi:hypothetical protein